MSRSRPEDLLRVFGRLPVNALLAPVKSESDTAPETYDQRVQAVNRAADQHLIHLRDSMIASGMDPHKANAAIAGYLSTNSNNGLGVGNGFSEESEMHVGAEDDATFERRYREELRQLLLVLNHGKTSSNTQQFGWRAEVDFSDPRAILFETPQQHTQHQQQIASSTLGGGGNNTRRPQAASVFPSVPQALTSPNSAAAEREDVSDSPAPKYPRAASPGRFPARKSPAANNNYNTDSTSNGTPFRPTNNGPSPRNPNMANQQQRFPASSNSGIDIPVIVKKSNFLQNHPHQQQGGGVVGAEDYLRPSMKFAARDSDLSVRTNQSEGAGGGGGGGFLKGGGRTSVFTTPPAFKGL